MSANFQNGIALFGRWLLSVIFLLSGANKFMNWSDNIAYMEAHQMPAIPLLLGLAAIAEIAGGLALATGFLTRTAAAGLFIYLIPTTLIFHNFWAVPPAEQQAQMINFLKNLAIMGGLLECVAWGAGAISLDALFARQGHSWFPYRPPMQRPT